MKVNVVGGGPAGLYFALLLKKVRPQAAVTVYERNAKGATYGFGVVLADRGLKRFRAADEPSYLLLRESMELLAEQEIRVPKGRVVVDSPVQAGSISRLRLLEVLHDCCAAADVRIVFDCSVASLDECRDADLVVGADGVNSVVRADRAGDFGPTSLLLGNRFAWYGVACAFPRSTLSFKRVHGGRFVGHYYTYAPGMSTFVAECDAHTWSKLGLEALTDAERKDFVEGVFRDELEGRELIANNSAWRQFSVVRNKKIVSGKTVLLGDAQRSMHFSIGSGTRLAMEDAISLAAVFEDPGRSVAEGLAEFQAKRPAEIRPLTTAARRSYLWYERFGSLLDLDPFEFAFAYMTRTGRLDAASIRDRHPQFYAAYEARRPSELEKKES